MASAMVWEGLTRTAMVDAGESSPAKVIAGSPNIPVRLVVEVRAAEVGAVQIGAGQGLRHGGQPGEICIDQASAQ